MWTRQQIEQHSVEMRQFIDFRQSTLDGGMRLIEAYNSSGLMFNILPDRGLDIWQASYNGKPLTWTAPGSPHPPDMGQEWLRQFNGGLLVTCGLTHVGPPETDAINGQWRDLHGLYSRLRASEVSIKREWHDDNYYVVQLSGVVSESILFGEQLRLERSYGLHLGEPTITIDDKITNIGDMSTPLMVLYHFNFGYPLVGAGTRLHTAHDKVVPRDARAVAGMDRWPEYDAPTPGYAEQVFFHHVKADEYGETEALLYRDDLAVAVKWDTRSLPYLTQWKNTRQGIYVSGIEPGNCLPEGRNAARSSGRLTMIEPGESREFLCSLTVLDKAEGIQGFYNRITDLQQTGGPASGCDLSGFPPE
jgi:galactose mutarotase-like enzyme